MTFAVEVQSRRWREHLSRVFADYSAAGAEVVPVIKSNGYGLGQRLLAREANTLGARTIAVGTVFEAAELLSEFAGDIVVLEPFQPVDPEAAAEWQRLASEPRIIATVAAAAAAAALPVERRAMLELASDMRRFGFPTLDEMPLLRAEGVTVHLPLQPTRTDLLALAERCGPTLKLSVSHVSAAEVSRLSKHAKTSVRLGTSLWLGERSALGASGTILELRKTDGSPAGYQLQRTRRGGEYAVVSGGTAHGVGLEAPAVMRGPRSRLVAVAKGLLAATGRMRSPFSIQGRKLEFVEPPHQHVSMVWLPRGHGLSVGDRLAAEVRFTITRADAVRWLD